MISHTYAASFSGIEATPVKVEVDVQNRGLPSWTMVGLLETAVKEARDRVSTAIKNAGYELTGRKTIINLSPADVKKSGSHYDLAIALCLLGASGVCKINRVQNFIIAGELSLTGLVLPVRGALLMALAAKKYKMNGLIVPSANAWEARLVDDILVVPVKNLSDVIGFINDGTIPNEPSKAEVACAATNFANLSEVKGQTFAKRALEIAAAGNHNIALKGPPGTGKTMLAERLPGILPPLAQNEALEVAKIQSWHGLLKASSTPPRERPFRAPHHCASYAGLIGGTLSGQPRLGEVSLAHNGVLFLDEATEFRKDVLEVLRQPLESGEVKIVRAGSAFSYPAKFILVLAFNPCRCGYFGHPSRPCICSAQQVRQYRNKLSGPLLDRIDLHVEVLPPAHESILENIEEETSHKIRERVMAARDVQKSRHGRDDKCNAALAPRELHTHCPLNSENKAFLKQAATRLNMTARSIHKVIKVARTISDLKQSAEIATEHIAEAIQFRPRLDEF